MDLYDVMRTTAAVRDFTDDPLPDDVLHTILDNARFAPSGGNRQGSQVVVVRDPATRERLLEITGPGARRYQAQLAAGETPWSGYVPSRVTEEQVAQTEVPDYVAEPLRARRRPGRLRGPSAVAALDKDLDRVGVVAGASVYPLVWNILLAARNEGFGGTITTMAVAEEPALKELLGIPEPYAVAAVVPLGKPVRQLTRLSRVGVDELTRRSTGTAGRSRRSVKLNSHAMDGNDVSLATISSSGFTDPMETERATWPPSTPSGTASATRTCSPRAPPGLDRPRPPPLRLVARDVEETVRFYQGVLEFPLTEIFENRDYPGSNHFFFDIGHDNLLAFFDFPGLDVGPYAEVLGGLHHIAISVEPEKWQRLKAQARPGRSRVPEESGTSIYFRDPDGARLELIADPLGEMYGTKVL